MLEGLERLDQELSNLKPTSFQKKAMTSAGADIYAKALAMNMESALHKGKHSRETSVKLTNDIKKTFKGADGVTYVGFKNSNSKDHGYLARILNDGYMAHGGKGSSNHTTRYIPGLHFQERTLAETKVAILAAEARKYREMLGD